MYGGKGMSDSLLLQAASVWKTILDYQYCFVYGYKKKLYTIMLSFSPADFPHLAGFQYLWDIEIPRFSPARTVDRILDGTITQAMVEKGANYGELVKPRLMALVALEEMLDNDFTLYSFMPRFYSFVTSIRADYLIASHYKNTSYVFMIREGERSVISDCVCCSAFVKDSRDYEQNQRSFALLHKSKTNLSSDTTSVLYVKEGFVLPSLRDEQ